MASLSNAKIRILELGREILRGQELPPEVVAELTSAVFALHHYVDSFERQKQLFDELRREMDEL